MPWIYVVSRESEHQPASAWTSRAAGVDDAVRLGTRDDGTKPVIRETSEWLTVVQHEDRVRQSRTFIQKLWLRTNTPQTEDAAS